MAAADDTAPAAGRDDDVALSDPRAIRALAHPARIAVLERLLGGAVLTATECAQIAGLTPSAMSYHLRALERYGLVGRAEASGDGRERPWRARAPGPRVGAETSPAGRAAEAVVLSSSLAPVDLTPDEARAVSEAVDALVEGFRDRPRPDAAVPYHLWWAAIPVGPTPGRSGAPPPAARAGDP